MASGVGKDVPFLIGSDKLPGLSKMVEEMGELNQAIGKLMGYGRFGIHWDGKPLKQSILEEMADVEATLEFFRTRNKLDKKFIKKRAKEKLKKFNRWHKNIQGGRDPNDDGEGDRTKRKRKGRSARDDGSREILASYPRGAHDSSSVQPKRKKQPGSPKRDAAQ